MAVSTAKDLDVLVQGAVEAVSGTEVRVRDEKALRERLVDQLALAAATADDASARERARWLIRGAARALGVLPASIHPLYAAMGRGEAGPFTCPAINVRGLAYDTCRAVFRAAKKIDASAFLFEIARSEISYTDQRPAEYAAIVLAAALREGWRGPVFIQGDHFQVNAKKYKDNADAEFANVRDLISEGIAAGFYNIDVDTSTLVDLSKPTIKEQ